MKFSLTRVFSTAVLAVPAATAFLLTDDASFAAFLWGVTGLVSQGFLGTYNALQKMAEEKSYNRRFKEKERQCANSLNNKDSKDSSLSDSDMGRLLALSRDSVATHKNLLFIFDRYRDLKSNIPGLEKAEQQKRRLAHLFDENFVFEASSDKEGKVRRSFDRSSELTQDQVLMFAFKGPLVPLFHKFYKPDMNKPVTLPNKTEEYKQTMTRWNALKPQ